METHSSVSPKSYRALIKRAAGPSGGTLLHLIPEDAEASLCGIPRPSLTTSGLFDELVCEECLEWLRKGWEEEREITRFSPGDLGLRRTQ